MYIRIINHILTIGTLLVAFIVGITCSVIDFGSLSDEEAPVVTLLKEKDTITVGDTSYEPQFTVTDNIDSQQDLLNNVVIWVKDASGTLLDIATFASNPGFYNVYLKVSDSDGNISEIVVCEVMVSERDKTPPVITIFGPSPYTINLGDTYHDPGAKAVDNIDGDVTDQIVLSGEVNSYVEADYVLTYTVTDNAGNIGTATRTVTVKDSDGSDKEKPVIELIGDNPFLVLVGQTYTDPGATATDNVDGDISSQIVTYDTNIATSVPDTHSVYYTVEDAAGNVAVATRSVIVMEFQDTVPPVITLLGDDPLFLETGATYQEPGATAVDNVDGDITDQIAINDDSVNTAANGVCWVYYSVSDAAGNAAEKQRRVVVGILDSIPPVITLLGPNPLLVSIYGTFYDPGAFAVDNVDDTISFGEFTVDNGINYNEFGTYTVTYTVSDAVGNEASAVRDIEVVDTSAPVIVLNGPNPVNLGLGYPYTERGVKSAIDNYDGDLIGQVDTSGVVNVNVGGTYTVTYRVTDSHGNEAVVERMIYVALDTDPPVITLLGDNPMTVFIGEPYIEPGATAYDSIDGDLSDRITIDGDVNSQVAGNYTITYTVSDTGGNTATAYRTVIVAEDDEPPVITLLGRNPMAVLVGDNYVEPGATAADNRDGDLTDQIITDASAVNTSVAGSYQVVYTVSDNSGNMAEKRRTVNVSADDVPPVITLRGQNPMELPVGQPYNEPGATAVDDVDGDITNRIEISGTVNTNVAGRYTVTYTVADNAGNQAQRTRTVNVTEGDAIIIEIAKAYTIDEPTLFTIHEDSLPASGSAAYGAPIHMHLNNTGTVFQVSVNINGAVNAMGAASWSFDNVSGPSPQDVSGDYEILITPTGEASFSFNSIQWY